MRGHLVSVVSVVVAAFLAAQCGTAPPAPGRPEPGRAAPSPAASAPPGSRASGCRATRKPRPGQATLTYGGLKRTYLLSVPKGGGPHPVLLDLHGLGSNAAEQSAYSRLAETGTRRGYIVATPQVAPGRYSWTLPALGGPDDTGFLGALLDHLEQGLCVNTRREFATGMSAGAGMSTALVCGLKGRLAAVAPVAGINIVQPCPQARPTTIITFHGTADSVVPYQGGHPLQNAGEQARRLGALVTLKPVEQAVAGWAGVLGCTGRTTTSPTPHVRLRTWKSCRAGARLALYTVKGGGHTWPGSIDVPRLGSTTHEVDATRLILDAFDHAPSR
jgi:polyhydroxybutyrate depolymerase